MLKKEIKQFFKAVREGDTDSVKKLYSENSEYARITNFSPPKKDDGQSPLQVAFKTGSFDIAEFLIDKGADVNFIETSEINEWTAPVIHDCLRSVVFSSYTFERDLSVFQKSFSLLKKMTESGADVNACDSYGNSCLVRALLDSNQAIDHPDVDFSGGILLNQLRSVLRLLVDCGADPDRSIEEKGSARDFIKEWDLEEYDLL